MNRNTPMVLCKHCIEELKSRGESLMIADSYLCTMEESEEENQPCEWCDEFDELWLCWFRS